jgi:hypothetical protein
MHQSRTPVIKIEWVNGVMIMDFSPMQQARSHY